MKTKLLAAALIAALAGTAQAAAQLIAAFEGNWYHATSINNGTAEQASSVSASISADTFHEPGYNCRIKSVHQAKDAADDDLPIYQVDMVCGGELERAYPVKSTWAIRKTGAGEVLVISSPPANGLGPSIEVFEKGESK
jgi:hypothetical protein